MSNSSNREELLQSFLDHQDQLREYVRARIPPRLRGEVDAEDIVQEVCARVLEESTRFNDLGEAACVSWLRHIAKNVMLDAIRRANDGTVSRRRSEVQLGLVIRRSDRSPVLAAVMDRSLALAALIVQSAFRNPRSAVPIPSSRGGWPDRRR